MPFSGQQSLHVAAGSSEARGVVVAAAIVLSGAEDDPGVVAAGAEHATMTATAISPKPFLNAATLSVRAAFS